MMKWFVGGLLLLLFAIAFKMGLLIYAIYAVLGVYFLSRYVTRSWANNLQATRHCNKLTGEIGETVAIRIEVANKGWLPIIWVLVEDLLPKRALMFRPPALEVQGKRITVTSLKAGAKQQLIYQLKCNRRGSFQIGPLVLETGDLFGLHRRFRVLSHPNYLLVYPKTIPLDGYDVASRRPIGEVTMTYRLYEDPTRIAGVREYQRGDPLNRIHWRATARTGKLHSKIYEPSTVIGATILLDFFTGSHERKHEPFRSELAITAAASIANAVYLTGQQVGLISNGRDAADRIRLEGWTGDSRTRDDARKSAEMMGNSHRLEPVIVPTRIGSDQFMQIREALARLELNDEVDFPSLTLEITGRLPRDATVIAILPKVTPEIAIALTNLRSQGYTITAIINIFDQHEFALASGPLLAGGIEVRQLIDEESITWICRKYALASIN
jgi:uncharacterized protein (DUF58 family)